MVPEGRFCEELKVRATHRWRELDSSFRFLELGRAFFTPLRSLEPQRARELVLPYRNPVPTDFNLTGGCRFGAGLGCWLRFRPDPHRPSLCLINIEGSVGGSGNAGYPARHGGA
jgi:hypothetical protein